MESRQSSLKRIWDVCPNSMKLREREWVCRSLDSSQLPSSRAVPRGGKPGGTSITFGSLSTPVFTGTKALKELSPALAHSSTEIPTPWGGATQAWRPPSRESHRAPPRAARNRRRLPDSSGQAPLPFHTREGQRRDWPSAGGTRSPPRPSAPARPGVSDPRRPLRAPAQRPARPAASLQPSPTPRAAGHARPTGARQLLPYGPSHCLPVFALVFLFLPHRLSASLVDPAFASVSHRPAVLRLTSVSALLRLPRSAASHPALHRPAHWDRAHMVWALSAQAQRPAASAWGRRARLIESCASGRASPVNPPAREEPERPLHASVRSAPTHGVFQVLEPGSEQWGCSFPTSTLSPRGNSMAGAKVGGLHLVQKRALDVPYTYILSAARSSVKNHNEPVWSPVQLLREINPGRKLGSQ
jgi:hypothetical protein